MLSYGILKQTTLKSRMDSHLEEVDIMGFTILPNILNNNEISSYRERVDKIYKKQENIFGKKSLKAINELNQARCLLAYDSYFINLLKLEPISKILNTLLGLNYVLTLQNSTISKSGEKHYQSSWHRDIPYQHYVTSKPIAINIYFCLDNYNEETGSMVVLPFSHKLECMPSEQYVEKYQIPLTADAGSVIVFNSWLYHRAGFNKSEKIRRGINHLYALPFIRQQIDIPRLLGDKYRDNIDLHKILGYEWETPLSVDEWRKNRLDKL